MKKRASLRHGLPYGWWRRAEKESTWPGIVLIAILVGSGVWLWGLWFGLWSL